MVSFDCDLALTAILEIIEFYLFFFHFTLNVFFFEFAVVSIHCCFDLSTFCAMLSSFTWFSLRFQWFSWVRMGFFGFLLSLPWF